MTTNPLNKTSAMIGRFKRDTRGAAAIEFAFIAPLLITMYLGTMEISQGIEANKKVGRGASVIGDLIAQNDTLTRAQIEDILNIGAAVLQPYDRTQATVTATAISIDASNNATVAWSRRGKGAVYTTPYAVNSSVIVPANLKIASTFLIRVVTELEYLPITSWSIQKNKGTGAGSYAAIDMAETYFLRPRLTESVTCTGC